MLGKIASGIADSVIRQTPNKCLNDMMYLFLIIYHISGLDIGVSENKV